MEKPILVLLSLITKIYFYNGIDLSSTNKITHQMLPLTDTTIQRSMSAQQNRKEQEVHHEQAEGGAILGDHGK